MRISYPANREVKAGERYPEIVDLLIEARNCSLIIPIKFHATEKWRLIKVRKNRPTD